MYINQLIMFFFPCMSVPICIKNIRRDSSRKKQMGCLFFLALFLAMVAYSYTPVNNNPDLVDYFKWMDAVSGMTFTKAWNYAYSSGKDNLHVFNVILWLFSKTGDKHLLPAVSTFFVYYICFYLTYDAAVRNNIRFKYVMQYIFFAILTLNYYGIVNNVRNILAFSLVALAVYRDISLNKKGIFTLFLYIFPVFLHSSAILIILVRLLLLIPGNYKLLAVLATSLIMPVTDFLYSKISIFRGSNIILQTIRSFIRSSYRYFRSSNSAWAKAVANSGSQKVTKAAYIALIVIMLLLLLWNQKKNRQLYAGEDGIRRKKLSDFIFYIGLTTVACTPMVMPEYWRFASLFLITAGIVFVPIFSDAKAGLRKVSRIIFLFTPICALLWLRNFLKCDHVALAWESFLMNPFLIVIKDLIQGLLNN